MGNKIVWAAFGAAGCFLVVTMACGVLQADLARRTISAGEPAELHLAAGEIRNVYLTPEESAALNFDFYPSDLACRMRAPGGGTVPGDDLSHEHRLVDGWNRHWGVASLRAEVTGSHEITCTDMSDRSYPLVLARPPRGGPFVVYPRLATLLFVTTGAVLAVSRLGRLRPRDRRRSAQPA